MSAVALSRPVHFVPARHAQPTRPMAPSVDPVLRRLATLAPDGEADWPAMFGSTKAYSIGTQIVTEGETAIGPRALRSGWACMVRLFRDGRRQIQHLILPGELMVPAAGLRSPSTVLALTPVLTIQISPHAAGAGIDTAMRLDAGLTQLALLAQTARLGRQMAAERLAHLLLELRDRLALAGLADGDRFAMPLTQEVLGDVLGLTSVHVNRTLQGMRREQTVDVRGGYVELLDMPRLTRMADYRPPRLV